MASVLAAAAAGPHAASAQSFAVGAGQTAGPQTMTGAGDTGTVAVGGSVEAPAGDAVQMFNSDQSVTNDGSIVTSGDAAANVHAQGDGATIVNAGSFLVTGDGSAGILAEGSGAHIVNAGSFLVTGDGSAGMVIEGSGSLVENSGTIAVHGTADFGVIGTGSYLTVLNSGSITADGLASAGIIWQGTGLRVGNTGSVVVSGVASTGIGAGGDDVVIDNAGLVKVSGDASTGIGAGFGDAVIVNSGSVSVDGFGVFGILVAPGDSASVENSGSIKVSGEQLAGIAVATDFATIGNSGSIVTSGALNIGVLAAGLGTTVTNSGRIISDQGYALYFGGDDATLNLLGGTAIQGQIVFGGGSNTATFGPGLNAVMTFSGSGTPATILTGGRPFVVDGNTVAVVDTTGFASAGAVVEDLTGGIAGTVEARLSGLRADDAGSAWRAWMAPFGMGRWQGADGAAAGFSDALGGVIAGAETNVAGDVVAGAFMGAAGGRTEVDYGAQDITHRSVFAGGYLGYDSGARFVDFSFTAGTLDESSRRRVANNLVLGGIETASADYNGVFVSPSLTLGMHMPYGTATLTPSLRLRYAGLFLDDYAETGSAGGMKVAGRDVHLFDARAQLALATAPMTTSAGTWQTTWRGGIDGIAQSAGDVSANLLGQDISFDAGGDRTTLRGFVGAGFTLSTGKGMRFGGDIETAYGTDDAFIARAQAHLAIAF